MKDDDRRLHVKLIRTTEEKIRLVVGSIEDLSEKQKQLISLDPKKAPGIPSEESVARLLTLKTESLELLELLEDLKRETNRRWNLYTIFRGATLGAFVCSTNL